MSTTKSEDEVSQHDEPVEEVTKWVREHTSDLLRYAASRVKEREVAEDLVQVTLIAAWKSKDRFAQQSSTRTWLFSILKNKIADHYRKVYRDPVIHSSDIQVDERFNEDGHWSPQHRPNDWSTDESAEKEALQRYLLHCLEQLPAHWRAAVEMKYLKEKDSKVICQELGITPTNYWQQLHRAKSKLRECITRQLAAQQ
ncbi:MAG: sigma-70 family RNA polymerase sigma factor [Flavobacteriales bacterium]|nr:sigma-70 family RNA polymerase sigma factor [Flavobacteriales bacterium]